MPMRMPYAICSGCDRPGFAGAGRAADPRPGQGRLGDGARVGSLGNQLDRLFQHAFATAKRARTDTRIGANPVSVASTAVRLAQESFARLADSTVLLIGAGETIELAARHLVQAKTRRLLIANRTLAHAQDLATRHGGYALALSELDRHLCEADVVISATAARDPILHKAQVAAALATRRHRPMLLLDLAVPRDIASDVAELKDIFLYTVDDLERAIEDNRRSRREAANEAEAIVELQVARLRRNPRRQHPHRAAQAPARARRCRQVRRAGQGETAARRGRGPGSRARFPGPHADQQAAACADDRAARSGADRQRRSRARRDQAVSRAALAWRRQRRQRTLATPRRALRTPTGGRLRVACRAFADHSSLTTPSNDPDVAPANSKPWPNGATNSNACSPIRA
jgi:hypothetical protein